MVTLAHAIRLATQAAPDDPMDGKTLRAFTTALRVGLAYEMADTRPSICDLAREFQMTRHAVGRALIRWRDMPFPDRAGWFVYASRQ